MARRTSSLRSSSISTSASPLSCCAGHRRPTGTTWHSRFPSANATSLHNMTADVPYRPAGGFVEVADRVYAGRYPRWDTTVGVVHGSGGALAVDTRGMYTAGLELGDDVRRLAPDLPIRWV